MPVLLRYFALKSSADLPDALRERHIVKAR
jgi:hypothetical protein